MITGHLEQARASNGKVYWRIRLDYGPDQITGTRSQPRLPGRYADQRTAKRKMAEIIHEANHGPRIVPSKRTVREVVHEWLEHEASVSVREKTIRDYRSACKLHVIPHLGHIPVQELTTASVRRFAPSCSAPAIHTMSSARQPCTCTRRWGTRCARAI